MLKKIIFSILSFLSLNVYSLNFCENVKTEVIYLKKTYTDQEKICFIKKNGITFIASPSCQNMNCHVLNSKKIKDHKYIDPNPEVGSPGFKLCYSLGGIPQIFSYFREKHSQVTSARCFFTEDDFIENSLLIDLKRGKIEQI